MSRLLGRAAQPGEHWTLWVRGPHGGYGKFKGVDAEQDVYDFTARWAEHEELNVRPSHISLHLVRCASDEPTEEDEAAATVLNPRRTLREAGVADSSSLLAKVTGVYNLRVALLPAHLQLVSVSAAQLIHARCTVALLYTLAPVAEHGMLEHVVEQVATRLLIRMEPLLRETRRLRMQRLDPWRNSNRSVF